MDFDKKMGGMMVSITRCEVIHISESPGLAILIIYDSQFKVMPEYMSSLPLQECPKRPMRTGGGLEPRMIGDCIKIPLNIDTSIRSDVGSD